MSESFFYSRNLYEEHLRPWVDNPVIKIITGMRRVGKSCVLKQLIAFQWKNLIEFLMGQW